MTTFDPKRAGYATWAAYYDALAKYNAEEKAKKAADTAVDLASKPGPF